MHSYKNVTGPRRLLYAAADYDPKILNLNNLTIYLASNQYETLSLFRPNFFNIVLLSYTLSDVIHTIRTIRFKEQDEETTILVYANNPTEPFILTAIYAGATDVITNEELHKWIKP